MKPITLIDISDFFELESIHAWRPAEIQLYEINLTSKITGEIVSFDLDEEHFDKLIKQIQHNIKMKCNLYHSLCMKGES